MSEDQIHAELSIIRTLINESNSDLSQQIQESQEKTLKSVDTKNCNLKDDVEKMIDGVKWMIGILIVVILSFGGWLAIDHLNLKADYIDTRTDIGIILKITSPDNDRFIGFQELMEKYYPGKSRGVSK
jgi:hypothetical protein